MTSLQTQRWFISLSVLSVLALIVGILPAPSRAQNDDAGELWINGVRATTQNYSNILGDGTAQFDPSTATLTLTNAQITQTNPHATDTSRDKSAGIFSTLSDLTISLRGANTISVNTSPACTYGIAFNNSGSGTLSFNGTGSLTVTTHDTVACNYGVYSLGNIVVDGPSLVLKPGKSQQNTSTALVAVGHVTINSGAVTALGNSGATDSRGIHAMEHRLSITGGKVRATGATDSLPENSESIGFESPEVSITGGEVIATGKTVASRTDVFTVPERMKVVTNTQPNANGATDWDGSPLNHTGKPYKYLSFTPQDNASTTPTATIPSSTTTPAITTPTPTTTVRPTESPRPTSSMTSLPKPPSTSKGSSLGLRIFAGIIGALGVIAFMLVGALGAIITDRVPTSSMPPALIDFLRR